jgi:hypothetical protein
MRCAVTLAHVIVGLGAVVALLSSDALADYTSVFLWIVGVPWVAGFVALFAAVWLVAEATAGIG